MGGCYAMKKILFVATVAEHFYYFHLPCFKYFKELGWQVEVACGGKRELPFCDKKYELPIKRSPSDPENLKAYKQLKKIIKNGHYDLIHCHTPMGGILTRLAAADERKSGTKIFYTAHGFHFYNGAPIANWLVYYPIEKIMSRLTDCLITINDEDFELAKKRLGAKKTVKVNGVGYNSDACFRIGTEEKTKLRAKHGYSADEKILIYVAEMNLNKNQAMLLRALKIILSEREDVRLLIVGADNFDGKYPRLAEELSVSKNVEFLGHRDDACELVKLSDIAVASSLREGLPVNVMEAMACGLPVVLADNRGHRALCRDSVNGFLVEQNDYAAMAEKVLLLLKDDELYKKISEVASENVKPFSKENVLEELKKIYAEFI